jgi:hypothetical protein
VTFYTGMAIAALLIIFAGFSRTFYLNSLFARGSFTPLVLAHGLVFSCWPILFLIQASLVATGRTHVHRRVGVAGAVLASLMIVLGLLTAIGAAKRGMTPQGGPPPLVFLAIPFSDLVVFGGLFSAAIYFRKASPTHKRLMVLATIALLTPAIARLPLIDRLGPPGFFGFTDLLVLVCVVHDRLTHGRVHGAYKWGGAALVLSQPLRLGVASTGAWLAFAQWLTR